MTDKMIGPRTLEEWGAYLGMIHPVTGRSRLAEFEEAVRERQRQDDADLHIAFMAEAETRPCPTCDGYGTIHQPIEGSVCPEPLCKDGRVPRDYAIAAEVIERIRMYAADLHAGRPSPNWVADQIATWSSDKYGSERGK